MNELMDGKEIYDRIKIPKELDDFVNASINNNDKKVSDPPMNNKRKHSGSMMRHTMVAAAAVIACFIITINSSETFAQTLSNLPVLGGIVRVLTIRSYQSSDDNMNISVDVPELVTDNSQNAETASDETITGLPVQANDTDQFVTDINAEIDKIVKDYLADAKNRMQADKEAFLATGGTEADWAKRDLNINVTYEVKYQQGNLLSLILSTDESWYNAYDMKYYYNLDLKENRALSLKDILGEDYKDAANASIIDQMKNRAAEDPDILYWGITDNSESGIDGFTSVDENTKFYLNEDGKPVVCFDKYEIAPGFMGAQEFVIDHTK